jgi:RNA polymerase sigma-70 factor (ECF subfamily)
MAVPSGETPEPEDEALMLAYAAGDAGAFDTLYARHRGGLYRYFLRHVKSAGTADEMFQDVWLNVIRVRASYAPTAKFSTWLYTLAHHRLVDHWRAHGRVSLVSIDNEDDPLPRAETEALVAPRTAQPDVRVAAQQVGARLLAALGALPDDQRDAFLLQHEGGHSLAEIAAITGVGAETVKSRLRYATTKLRTALGDLE